MKPLHHSQGLLMFNTLYETRAAFSAETQQRTSLTLCHSQSGLVTPQTHTEPHQHVHLGVMSTKQAKARRLLTTGEGNAERLYKSINPYNPSPLN